MRRGDNKGEEELLVGVREQCGGVGGKRRGNGECDEKAVWVFRGKMK